MWRYHQYCPVARAAEIFADRWTPLIVRELPAGSSHFNQIQRGLPGISRTLLSTRLRSLEDAGVVTRSVGDRPHATEYRRTTAGEELSGVIERLGQWGSRWAFESRARTSWTRSFCCGRCDAASASSGCLRGAWSSSSRQAPQPMAR